VYDVGVPQGIGIILFALGCGSDHAVRSETPDLEHDDPAVVQANRQAQIVVGDRLRGRSLSAGRLEDEVHVRPTSGER
jgi:hypothetical protein